jgi:hypothetical protein
VLAQRVLVGAFRLLGGVADVLDVEGDDAVVDLVVVAALQRRAVDVVRLPPVELPDLAEACVGALELVADLVDGAAHPIVVVVELLAVDRTAGDDEVHLVGSFAGQGVLLAAEGVGAERARVRVDAQEIVLHQVEDRGPDGAEGALVARGLLEDHDVHDHGVVRRHQKREERRRDDDLDEREAALPHGPSLSSGGWWTAVHAERACIPASARSSSVNSS